MNTYGFIGLGLIGGSLARMIRDNYPEASIVCYSRNKDKITPALRDGIIDTALPDIGSEFAKCDIIFLCTPVSYFPDILGRLKAVTDKDCLITDVGSVKAGSVKAAASCGLGASFIGGHPMAGSEKTGYENSSKELLQACTYILTPTNETPGEKLDKLKSLLETIGCRVEITTPEMHDYATAGISHLPHISAVALANTIKKADTKGLMKLFAASGFKDTTRIAASSPEVWEQISMANADNLVKLLDEYIKELKSMRECLVSGRGAGINEAFRSAGDYLRK